jgi:hypothetical protein
MAAAVVHAQSVRLVGNTTGASFHVDMVKHETVQHASFMFGDPKAPVITIEFIAQYLGDPAAPRSVPAVVDMIITANDPLPETSLTVNGLSVAQTVRPRTPRAIVSTMTFDEFFALANADAIVQRAFDTELVFGASQLRMLRSVAQRWNGAPVR